MALNLIALVVLIALVAGVVRACVGSAHTTAPRALMREALAVLAPTIETTPPVLARRVLRCMVESVTIGLGGTPLVPTGFMVFLAPADAAMLEPVRRWFCNDVAKAFVIKLSTQSGLGPVAAPNVTLAVEPSRPVGAPRAVPTYTSVTVVGRPTADRPEKRTTQPDIVPMLVGQGGTWRLQGSAVVGRSSNCDVLLASEVVSRSHCRVFLDGGGWAVEDLDSQNGTAIGTKRVRGPAPLHNGDELVLAGTVSLRFIDRPSGSTQSTSLAEARR
ncbi:MAG: FHA domain-containing protein [Acidimicrobiales bacterium]